MKEKQIVSVILLLTIFQSVTYGMQNPLREQMQTRGQLGYGIRYFKDGGEGPVILSSTGESVAHFLNRENDIYHIANFDPRLLLQVDHQGNTPLHALVQIKGWPFINQYLNRVFQILVNPQDRYNFLVQPNNQGIKAADYAMTPNSKNQLLLLEAVNATVVPAQPKTVLIPQPRSALVPDPKDVLSGLRGKGYDIELIPDPNDVLLGLRSQGYNV